MNKNFDIEVTGMGFNITGYPGAFTPTVKKIIEKKIWGKVLHLFSGQSEIGEERIDIEHINATQRINVKDFLKTDNRNWDWILLDPPYKLIRKRKTKEYTIQQPFSADVELRSLIRDYAIKHTNNILWLDYCAPMIKGFRRRKLWLLLPGGYHNVRILSWLIKPEEHKKNIEEHYRIWEEINKYYEE